MFYHTMKNIHFKRNINQPHKVRFKAKSLGGILKVPNICTVPRQSQNQTILNEKKLLGRHFLYNFILNQQKGFQQKDFMTIITKHDTFTQGYSARKVISEVCASIVLQCTVSGHRKLLCELSKISKFNAFNLLGY